MSRSRLPKDCHGVSFPPESNGAMDLGWKAIIALDEQALPHVFTKDFINGQCFQNPRCTDQSRETSGEDRGNNTNDNKGWPNVNLLYKQIIVQECKTAMEKSIVFFPAWIIAYRSVVAAIRRISVMKMKKTKRRAETEPVGILRLGRFNSPRRATIVSPITTNILPCPPTRHICSR